MLLTLFFSYFQLVLSPCLPIRSTRSVLLRRAGTGQWEADGASTRWDEAVRVAPERSKGRRSVGNPVGKPGWVPMSFHK